MEIVKVHNRRELAAELAARGLQVNPLPDLTEGYLEVAGRGGQGPVRFEKSDDWTDDDGPDADDDGPDAEPADLPFDQDWDA